MRMSFPELTELRLSTFDETPPVTHIIPDSFLDGSAPRLRFLSLWSVPFPGLSNLLLSATHLVHLCLRDISEFWCMSPEAMVASLSLLSSLEILRLEFRPP